jgi:hypothetical protein
LNCLKENGDSHKNFFKSSDALNGMFISIIVHSFILISAIISIGVIACFVSNHFELLFKIIILGFIILDIIYPIQIISNANWVINTIVDYEGVTCGDRSLDVLLNEISSACSQLENSYMLILFIAIISLVILIYSLYRLIKPANKEVQEKLLDLNRQISRA